MFTVGVSGVVRNAQRQVLLVRTEHAGWELPGGRIERGEDLHAALRREVLEESGCAVHAIGRLTGVYQGVAGQTLMVVFAATSETAEPRVTGEDEDVRAAAWFDASEALERVTHLHERQRLADALDATDQATYRAS